MPTKDPTTKIQRDLPILPYEIINIIFRLLQGSSGGPYDFADVASPPWVFGRVCQQWRAVSLRDARLWSRPFIRGNECTCSKVDPASLLERFLENAKGEPLEWSYSEEESGEEDEPAEYLHSTQMALIAPLLRRASQWKSINIDAKAMTIQGFSTIMAFPLLEHVTLSLSRDATLQRLRTVFLKAPELRSVSMSLFPYEQRHAWAIAFPINQLEMYEGSTPCSLRYFLSKTPRLSRATVLDASSGFQEAAFRHCTLTSLTVNTGESLQFLELPSLRSLSFTSPCPSNIRSIPQLYKDDPCGLTQLTIMGFEKVTLTEIICLFETLQKVAELTLIFESATPPLIDSVLRLLNPTLPLPPTSEWPVPSSPSSSDAVECVQGPPVPCLENLSLLLGSEACYLAASHSAPGRGCARESGQKCIYDSLIELLESRWFVEEIHPPHLRVRRLKRISFSGPRTARVRVLSRFEALVEQGLVVEEAWFNE